MIQSSGRTFVALRMDGLGQRLWAILNAMVLAEVTEGHFLFNWRARKGASMEFHAVLPSKEMFSPEFLKAYHCSDLDAGTLLPLQDASQAILDGRPSSGEKIRVDHIPLTRQLRGFLTEATLSSLIKEAFWKIEFSEDLEYARRLALEVSLGSEATALHLRAGDVVYGFHRYSGLYTQKVYPFPLALRVIEDCQARGARAIIFGQDEKLHEWLKEVYGVLDPRELLAGESLSETQLALFELTLMSRCHHIFAGNSGFATLPALIAGTRVVPPEGYVEPGVLLDILRRGLVPGPQDSRVSHMQRAIACWSAVQVKSAALTQAEKGNWALLALSHDPANTLYAMYAASIIFQAGDATRAEEVLQSQISQGTESLESFDFRMKYVFRNPLFMHDGVHLNAFRSAVERGAIIAAYYLAYADRALGDNKQAAANAALFLARRPPELAYLDASLSWAGPRS